MAPTMPRPIRVPDAEWQAALAAARAMGETLTDVVRRALRAYAAAVFCTDCGHLWAGHTGAMGCVEVTAEDDSGDLCLCAAQRPSPAAYAGPDAEAMLRVVATERVADRLHSEDSTG